MSNRNHLSPELHGPPTDVYQDTADGGKRWTEGGTSDEPAPQPPTLREAAAEVMAFCDQLLPMGECPFCAGTEADDAPRIVCCEDVHHDPESPCDHLRLALERFKTLTSGPPRVVSSTLDGTGYLVVDNPSWATLEGKSPGLDEYKRRCHEAGAAAALQDALIKCYACGEPMTDDPGPCPERAGNRSGPCVPADTDSEAFDPRGAYQRGWEHGAASTRVEMAKAHPPEATRTDIECAREALDAWGLHSGPYEHGIDQMIADALAAERERAAVIIAGAYPEIENVLVQCSTDEERLEAAREFLS